ncbi:hypothetical protein M2092_001514 [Fusobacterium sp. PH5-44]
MVCCVVFLVLYDKMIKKVKYTVFAVEGVRLGLFNNFKIVDIN